MSQLIPYLPSIVVFGYEVPTMPILTVVCTISYFLITVIETRRLKLSLQISIFIALATLILYNIFGRLLFVLSHIFLHQDFAYQNKILWVYTNQKIAFGFLIAQFLAILLGTYLYQNRYNLKKYFDIFILAQLSLFFIRLGGALMQYPIGKITDSSFWGFHYWRYDRHNPALYEAFSLFLIFIIALWLRKRIKVEGLLALIILAWISLSRVITDFFRSKDLPLKSFSDPKFDGADTSSNFHFENGLALNQIVYAVLFLTAITLAVKLIRKEKSFLVRKTPKLCE